ncbi:MAG TPA: ABC transporter permease [Polyangiaceae bacterium]|nr:ABC transporter permease [Polyangiaceae bacterium]
MSRIASFVWVALSLAFGALRRNLLRALLTAFGILIGVAAVTIVVALGEGANKAILGRIDSMGNNALLVIPEETAASGAKSGEKMPMLSEADGQALLRESSGIAAVAPVLRSFNQVSWRDANVSTQIMGSTLSFFPVGAWTIGSGTLWPASAENVAEKVCVIGSSVKANLFGDEDPVGHSVRIGRYPFTVVGVLAAKGQGPFGQDQDDVIVMPIATLRAKLAPTRPGAVDRLAIAAKSADGAARVERDVTAILRQRHDLTEGMENDFRVRSQEEFRRTQEQILGVLSALLLAIAAVSLVAGGIGVMNIMLVSVAERTHEIGIRMAIGARESDILLQFLVEAVVLCLAGGAAGALLAAFAVNALGSALGWAMSVSAEALLVALGTSSLLGVGFGFLPARRAARLDPIQALRRE